MTEFIVQVTERDPHMGSVAVFRRFPTLKAASKAAKSEVSNKMLDFKQYGEAHCQVAMNTATGCNMKLHLVGTWTIRRDPYTGRKLPPVWVDAPVSPSPQGRRVAHDPPVPHRPGCRRHAAACAASHIGAPNGVGVPAHSRQHATVRLASPPSGTRLPTQSQGC